MDLIEQRGNAFRHPWELSRTACILKQLHKLNIHGNILDIGCGDSYFDRRLLEVENEVEAVYGVDINLNEELFEDRLCAVNSPDHLPDMLFDGLIMMDVLEHIEDDSRYLKNIIRLLKPDATIFITVPAFMRLYSLHDREFHHYRRYDHKMLKKVLDTCGLCEIRWSYFYFLLIPARLLTFNKSEDTGGWKYPENHIVTKLMNGVLNADFAVLEAFSKIGIHIPGLSLMSACRLK